jgi:hypothetical protein
MNEDVKKSVNELATLYIEGNKSIEYFQNRYNKLTEGRFQGFVFQTYSPFEDKTYRAKPIENYDEFKELEKAVADFDKEWVKAVDDILASVAQVRFRLQFNDPQTIGFFVPYKGSLPPKIEALADKIDDLTSRVGELRKIVIDLEKTTEQIKPVDTKDIEPATYDKKTRTIFFADEAIRFKKDATYTPALCELIFNHPEKKVWQLKDLLRLWDEVAYFGNLEAPNDWHKVYEAVKRINDRVKEKTGIDDLFLFSTTSVRLNPAYLKVTKKSQ